MPRVLSLRPAIEELEPRTLAAIDLQMLSATTLDSHSVTFDYAIHGTAHPFEVRVYRSADAILGNGNDVALAHPFTIRPPAAGRFSATVPVALPPDAAHPYVFVAADPGGKLAETSEANNTQYFRIFLIGAVTHGFEMTPGVPAWATALADTLRQGYDAAFAFDWSRISMLARPGMTQRAARSLERRIVAEADHLPLHRGDVIDLDLIGHSRGAGVSTQAIADLASDPAFTHSRALRGGWIELTWLDAHPARNLASLATGLAELAAGTDSLNRAAWFSYIPSSSLSQTALSTILSVQQVMDDPLPVVPRIVDRLDVIWQNNPAPALSPRTTANAFDNLANAWGYSPAKIAALGLNPSHVPLHSIHLTAAPGFGLVSHYEVPLWYLKFVAPTLVRPAAPGS